MPKLFMLIFALMFVCTFPAKADPIHFVLDETRLSAALAGQQTIAKGSLNALSGDSTTANSALNLTSSLGSAEVVSRRNNGQTMSLEIGKSGNSIYWIIDGASVKVKTDAADNLFLILGSGDTFKAAAFGLMWNGVTGSFSLPDISAGGGSLAALHIADNLLLGDWVITGSIVTAWTSSHPQQNVSLLATRAGTEVPEVACLILLGTGILGLALLLKKRKSSSTSKNTRQLPCFVKLEHSANIQLKTTIPLF